MKMKMKFDKKAALELLFQYAEHVVFACVVLCFLFFVYKSFARERYEKTPQDLIKAADNAIRTIESTVPPPPPENEVTVRDQIEQISGKLAEDPYRMPYPFNSPIFEPRSKRGVPSLYTVEALRGTPGVGCFSTSTGGGMGGGPGMGGMPGMGGRKRAGLDEDSEPLGKRWVMLTGLVDLKKQTEAYRECFKDAGWKNPQTDQAPIYYAFWVERAEITDGQSEENLKWEQPYRSLRVEMEKCGGILGKGFGSNSDVASNFLNPRLTFSLPSLTDRDWDEAVAHPPEIPLLGYGEETMTKLEDPEEKEKEEEPVDPDDPGFDFARGRGGARGRMGPGMGGEMGMGGPGMGGPGMGGPGMGMPGRGGVRGRVGFGMTGKELSPYLLFRFIDLNVEPGKQYRYRVCIGFNNPNYNVEPRFLIDELQEVIAADKNRQNKEWKRYIKSDWSEPSDVISVPRDDQVLLAEVSTSSKFDAEPKAKIMAVHWDMQNGIEVSDDFEDIRRGMLANFLDHEVKNPQLAKGPGRGMIGGPGMGGEMMGEGMMGPGMGGRPAAKKAKKTRPKKDKKARGGDDLRGGGLGGPGRGGGALGNNNLPEKIDFKTQCLVLDLRGGQRLPGKNRDLNEPGEMLLLDPDGNLVVRNDVEDFEQYLKQKYPPKREQRMGGRRGGMGGPGMGGPGMGGEMMGEGMMGGPRGR